MQRTCMQSFPSICVDALKNKGRCSVMFLSAMVVVDTLRNEGRCSGVVRVYCGHVVDALKKEVDADSNKKNNSR